MAEQWFFDDDLVRLRLEWVNLMREYSRTRHRSVLAKAHQAHKRYLDRAERLRSAELAELARSTHGPRSDS